MRPKLKFRQKGITQQGKKNERKRDELEISKLTKTFVVGKVDVKVGSGNRERESRGETGEGEKYLLATRMKMIHKMCSR